MKKTVIFLFFFLLYASLTFSQETSINAFKPEYLNWYNLDLKTDGILGASVDKTYKEILQNKKPKKLVVVAVIDGGVDINSKDLQGKIWVNDKEIANNNIDDDKNGFIDDIHGWNFIGNSKGENINFENLEYTRIYKSGSKEKEYPQAKKQYEAELAKRLKDKDTYAKFEEKYLNAKKVIKDKVGIDVTKLEDLSTITNSETDVAEAVSFLKQRYSNGFTEQSFARRKERNAEYLNYYLNLNFNPRVVTGDNPDDINNNQYGNGDVKGPRSSHGTCVAGIIAGIRNNGIGINGVANDVKIMVLRVVPDGDERDKDVALAIRYAVDNGADILNLSFGKSFSPQQSMVNDAIRYAEGKNVLIIHAAGNSAENADEITHYPTDIYMDQTEASNFINVGASGMEKNETLACIFSNYGQAHVDIFAPGEDIISLDTSNLYDVFSGTSQATPVVTGVAATILSYYPELKPQDLIKILMESSLDLKKQKVQIPDLKNDKRDIVKFKTLSKSGGIVNLYNALKMAEKYKM